MKRPDFFHTDQQKRVLEIDRMLRTPGGMTRSKICHTLSVKGYAASRHTFIRDIEHMRDDLGAPIDKHEVVDSSEHNGFAIRWLYKDPTWTLKNFKVTEGTLLSLLVVRQTVEQYAGHPIAEELTHVYDKLAESLNRKVSLQDNVLAPVSFSPQQTQDINTEIWSAVLKATNSQKLLRISYGNRWKKGTKGPKERTIHPYHIVNLVGTWYLLGSASKTDLDVRQYTLEQIRSAKVLQDNCTVPEDFDIEDRLGITFGRYMGDPANVVDVRLRFNQRVAPLVMKRINPKETRKVLPSGDIEITFPASRSGPWPLFHVKSWVLSWGSNVEVLEPDELRELVQRDAQSILKCY